MSRHSFYNRTPVRYRGGVPEHRVRVDPSHFLVADSYLDRVALERALTLDSLATVDRQSAFDLLTEIKQLRAEVIARSAELQRYASRLADLGAGLH